MGREESLDNSWFTTPMSRLAYIVLLDQFPRNIYRNSPLSFATDHLALKCTMDMIEDGSLSQLPHFPAKHFCLMPLMHSEEIFYQDKLIEMIQALKSELTDERERKICDDLLQYSEAHRVVIQKYGRFPHRNVILMRESTPEELEYLATPGAGF
jgi:uncharacterized protein (DUF924 family)